MTNNINNLWFLLKRNLKNKSLKEKEKRKWSRFVVGLNFMDYFLAKFLKMESLLFDENLGKL